MSKRVITLLATVLMPVLLSGCLTPEGSMICFSPDAGLRPQSRDEFFAELKSRMPFEIREQDFTCYPGEQGLVGWLILEDSSQSHAAVRRLRGNSGFRLLSVGRFPILDRDMFLIAQNAGARRDF